MNNSCKSLLNIIHNNRKNKQFFIVLLFLISINFFPVLFFSKIFPYHNSFLIKLTKYYISKNEKSNKLKLIFV